MARKAFHVHSSHDTARDTASGIWNELIESLVWQPKPIQAFLNMEV